MKFRCETIAAYCTNMPTVILLCASDFNSCSLDLFAGTLGRYSVCIAYCLIVLISL